MPSACPPADVLTAFASGEVSPAELEPLAAHVEACPDCQVRLAACDARSVSLVEALRRAVPAVPGATSVAQTSAVADSGATAATQATVVAPVPRDDVRALLRRRLLVTGVVGAVIAAGLTVGSLAGKDDAVTGASRGLGGPVALAAYGLYAAGATAYLLRRTGASLRDLRLVELGHVVAGAAYAVHFRWAAFAAAATHEFANDEHRALFVQQSVLLGNLVWYALIVGYGVLIPNTARRAAAVTGGLAAAGLGSIPAAAAGRGFVADQLPTLLGVTAVGVFIAGAIGIFGSYRVHTLQSQVLAARRLGPYRLIRRLGAGGMGEVHLAEHDLLKRPCAVKLIRPERAHDAGLLQRFEREVQATARLTHPNTVEVFDYGRTEDGTFYYVMEYIPGITLAELVRREGPLPPGRALGLLRQLCGALAEAHEAGLVHRDIKPNNVMVCERGGNTEVLKLLDFGLVRLPDGEAGLTQEGIAMGTPDYMSPEQAASAPTDPRSDVYGLGAVAYFVLTGRPPFEGASVVDVLIAHRQLRPRPPRELAPDVPAALEAAILRCLEKGPAERFPDVRALDAALAACQSDPGEAR